MFSEEPVFSVKNTLNNFPGRPNSNFYLPEVRYDALYEEYCLNPNSFRERVASLSNPIALNEEHSNLIIDRITSIDIRAANSGYKC